jgi:hypothetical protein
MGSTFIRCNTTAFILWGHVKTNVSKTSIKDLAKLKMSIDKIKMISKETNCNAFPNVWKQMNLCTLVDSDHLTMDCK